MAYTSLCGAEPGAGGREDAGSLRHGRGGGTGRGNRAGWPPAQEIPPPPPGPSADVKQPLKVALRAARLGSAPPEAPGRRAEGKRWVFRGGEGKERKGGGRRGRPSAAVLFVGGWRRRERQRARGRGPGAPPEAAGRPRGCCCGQRERHGPSGALLPSAASPGRQQAEIQRWFKVRSPSSARRLSRERCAKRLLRSQQAALRRHRESLAGGQGARPLGNSRIEPRSCSLPQRSCFPPQPGSLCSCQQACEAPTASDNDSHLHGFCWGWKVNLPYKVCTRLLFWRDSNNHHFKRLGWALQSSRYLEQNKKNPTKKQVQALRFARFAIKLWASALNISKSSKFQPEGI